MGAEVAIGLKQYALFSQSLRSVTLGHFGRCGLTKRVSIFSAYKVGVDFSASLRMVIQVLSSVELYEKSCLTQEYFRYYTIL